MSVLRKLINKTEAAPEISAPADSAANFINGEWAMASDGQMFDDINPTTRQTWTTVANSGASDMTKAVDAAAAAQPGWEALPPAARAGMLYKAAEIFEANQMVFAEALIAETGSGFGKAMFECSLVPLAIREAAGLTSQPIGEIYPSNVPDKINRTERSAAGVVGVISPWNFPLYLSLRGFIYALALGNTTVLKPSEDSPVTGGTLLAELFETAGFPPGVFNVVTCGRDNVEQVAGAMINDTRVKVISFTGSTAVGQKINVDCARNFKKVVLEMGGKNPIIVLDDADLDYAVNAAFFSSFMHQGQICMSADKLIVARPLYDSFLEKLTAKVAAFKPLEPSNQMAVIGPIINDRQLDRIDGLVKAAQQGGAKVHVGGEKQGPFYQGTVISDIKPDMDIYTKEIFGPVALVIPFDSEEEALGYANDSTYGLSAGIITSNGARGEALARKVEAGMVHVNDTCVHDEPHCPFGGMKSSGGGGKWGASGAIEAFTTQRWISTQTDQREYPF
jgi:acyl-CoA reductase-like NAD-dependent aldehyde dehydrogenase